ncbi:hypothetical protein MKW92_051451 [Papaver armeniacum]|nr:hypothetical protein MKW92_051451 [Papaver armeniacum]
MVHELRSGFMFRAPQIRDLVEGSSRNKYKNPDKKRKRSNKAMEIKAEQNPCSDSVQRLRKVIHDQAGQPANTEISSSPGLKKGEICMLAPIVRCPPPHDKTSENCIQEGGCKQDIDLGEGYHPVLPGKTDIPVPPEVKKEEGPLKASCRRDVQSARMMYNAIPQVYARGQSIISGQQKLEGDSQQTTDSEEAKGSTRSNTFKRQRRVTHDQTGLPTKTEIANSRELEKEICVPAPTVRCPQNGRTSENCIQKDGTEQDMDLVILRSQHVLPKQQINDSEEADGSPKNAVVVTNQQLRDSEEATESPSSDISKMINQVEMIYSNRMEKLLAIQSKKSLQFKEARNRIENELTIKLGKEHSDASFLVRKMHRGHQARLDGMKNVDEEFIKKLQLIRTHLNTEQVKLDSIHEADKKKERKLKSHWMREAKSGREVDMYSILPQFLHSCFNLDDLKNPSEPLLLNSSNNANPVLPQALKLEGPTAMDTVSELVQSNESKGGIRLVLQLQSPLPTNAPSEPGNGTRVSGNSLLCQRVQEEKHVQVLKFDEQLAGNCKVDQAQPVKFCKELSLDPSDQFGVQRTSHWWDPVTAPGLRGGSPVDIICIPEHPPADVICISDDDN